MTASNHAQLTSVALLFTGLLFCLMPLVTKAEEPLPFGKERFRLDIGAFLPAMNTNVRVDSPSLGVGDQIDFEDDLNYDKDVNTARLDGYYRFTDRHSVQFSVFELSRSAKATLVNTIQFGDIVFPAGTSVTSENNVLVTELGYQYSFLKTSNMELSATAGIYLLQIDSTIKSSGGALNERATASGPLPQFGLDLKYAFTPAWYVSARGQVFQIEMDTYDGSLTNLRLGVDYFGYENLGFGIGYNKVNLNVSVAGSDYDGKFSWQYEGFQIYTILRFQ